jgi:hypothetical protein
MRTLRYRGPCTDGYRSERVKDGAVTDGRMVADSQVPGNCDPDGWIDVNALADAGAKDAQ